MECSSRRHLLSERAGKMKPPIQGVVSIVWLLLGICTVVQHPVAAQTQRGTDIAVVVNPETPVTELSLAEVRKVFLGERQYWNAKLPGVLFIRAPAARRRDCLLRLI